MSLAFGALAASAQDSTFSIVAEEVRVDVLVTENGKPIEGLEVIHRPDGTPLFPSAHQESPV